MGTKKIICGNSTQRTTLPNPTTFDHSKSILVRYSDGYCKLDSPAQKRLGGQVFDEQSLFLLKVLLHFSSNYLMIKLTSISEIKIKVIRHEKFIDYNRRSLLAWRASDLSPAGRVVCS